MKQNGQQTVGFFKSDLKKRRISVGRTDAGKREERGMKYAYDVSKNGDVIHRGGAIRTLAVSLLGAAVLAAGLLVIRHQKIEEQETRKEIRPGETVRSDISLDRLRELGI